MNINFRTKERIKLFLLCVLYLIVAFIGISKFVWQIRNPLANSATAITHFVDMVTFQKLEKFQPRE